MIDEKTLAQWEQDAIDAGLLGYAEAFRNARRYLALRESGNYSPGAFGDKWGLRMTGAPLTQSERAQLDAAADRLLEGGE